jgi:coiled-coil domain-containing protein 40
VENHQAELSKISDILKQVDLYNEELRSKILVAKRTTLKAEKDIIAQELAKKRQDFFIDHLTEQTRKLQEKRATYEAQLAIQQRETKAAVTTLQDASTEMEVNIVFLIHTEKGNPIRKKAASQPMEQQSSRPKET